jgi:hypothetical protein
MWECDAKEQQQKDSLCDAFSSGAVKKCEIVERYSARLLDRLFVLLHSGKVAWGEYYTSTVCRAAASVWNCTMHDMTTDSPSPFQDRPGMFRIWTETETLRYEEQGVIPTAVSKGDKNCTCHSLDPQSNCHMRGKWLHGFKYLSSVYSRFGQQAVEYLGPGRS